MSLKFLPSLGTTGLWALNAPYNNLVLATTPYECISVISLAGAIAQGQDPLNDVYVANGDSAASFTRDLSNDDYLVIIKSGPGDVVTFPRSAMTSVPSANGVVYRNTVMMVSLSAIPDTLDTTVLAADAQALVLNSLGVKTSVYFADLGTPTILTTAQSAALEAARNLRIVSPESTLYRVQQLQTQLTQAQETITALENYIRTRLST